jgi:hypothetical protein
VRGQPTHLGLRGLQLSQPRGRSSHAAAGRSREAGCRREAKGEGGGGRHFQRPTRTDLQHESSLRTVASRI